MSAPSGAWWSTEDTREALATIQQPADTAGVSFEPVANALRLGKNKRARGLRAKDIKKMPMSDFAKLRRRAGLRDVNLFNDAYSDFEPPGTPRTASGPEAAQANQDMGLDFGSMSMEQYAQLRDQLGVGRGREYGRGALDGASTADWIAAAQAKSGRAAMNTRNVVESPSIVRQFLNPDEYRDTRTVTERFSDQSTYFRPSTH